MRRRDPRSCGHAPISRLCVGSVRSSVRQRTPRASNRAGLTTRDRRTRFPQAALDRCGIPRARSRRMSRLRRGRPCPARLRRPSSLSNSSADSATGRALRTEGPPGLTPTPADSGTLRASGSRSLSRRLRPARSPWPSTGPGSRAACSPIRGQVSRRSGRSDCRPNSRRVCRPAT